MPNELISPRAMTPIMPSVEQAGKNNVHVTNQDGGVVNINYTINTGEPTDSADKMIAIQRFSREYYQLIVTGEEDVFDTNVVTVTADRALTQRLVPPEIFERCSTLTEDGIAELLTFPAIVCRENTAFRGETDANQYALYCYIKRIKKEGRYIKVGFKPILPFPQIKMCTKKNALYFDLNMDCTITDLNHSAWSVHKVNLFDAFDEAGLSHMPRPY